MLRFDHPRTKLRFLSTLARARKEDIYKATVNKPVSGRFRKDVMLLAMINYQ